MFDCEVEITPDAFTVMHFQLVGKAAVVYASAVPVYNVIVTGS
jgi:hypothetical protein